MKLDPIIKEMNNPKIERINKITIKIGGLLMGLSYIPQIYKIITTKNVEGISLAFLTMVTLAVMTFTLDGYVIYRKTGEKKTMLAQLANLIPAIITVILILVYK